MSRSAISPILPQLRPSPSPELGEPVVARPLYEFCKRGLDLGGSFVLLVIFSPLFLALAVGVKLSSPGPILFRQKRLGRGGKTFWCYKFRTMVEDAESLLAQCRELRARFDENYKLTEDPRITRLGSVLRRTSLDELPQLWNVFRGDMSLIGPRPIVEPELSKYGPNGRRLLEVKPGLGGLWQVSGRSNTTYAERILMDMAYVERRSFWLDVKLLIATAVVVIRGRGAY